MKKALAGAAGALVLAAGGTSAYLLTSGSSSTPFSFQAAYDSASNGAVIQVPAGQVATEAPSRGSSTIFGSTQKSVTFVCDASAGSGSVTQNPSYPRLTIKAFNVTIDGGTNRCFDLLAVDVGEGGDSSLTASNVTVENAHLLGAQVTGASNVSFLNDEIGPNVYCYAQGKTGTGLDGGPITPAMWCDPNGPSYEAQFASRGNADLPELQPYIHNNAGGLIAKNVLFQNDWIHDLQTKDAFNLHTGAGLIWNSGGQTFPNNIVFRDDRFERYAVIGLLAQGSTNGVTLTGNEFGPPMEPFSNTLNSTCTRIIDPCALKVAGTAQKELIAKDPDSYNGWRISNNTFCHGTRANGATITDTSFDSNDLGIANVLWPGATYSNNIFVGAGCSLGPFAWPPGGGGTTTTSTTSSTSTTSTTTTSSTTTTQPPPPDPDRVLFCDEFVPSIQGNSYYSKWKAANPGELSRWEPYRDGLCNGQSPAPPTMKTLYGKALVAAGKEAA